MDSSKYYYNTRGNDSDKVRRDSRGVAPEPLYPGANSFRYLEGCYAPTRCLASRSARSHSSACRSFLDARLGGGSRGGSSPK